MHQRVSKDRTTKSLGRWPELTPEQVNDLLGRIRHAGEFRKYTKSSHGIASVIENYLGFYRDMHVHVFGRSGGLPANFCAIYQLHPSFKVHIGKWAEGLDCFDGDELDASVFVGVVYLVKQPKRAVRLPIPSMVRLQSLEQCNVPPFQVRDFGTVPSRSAFEPLGEELSTILGNGSVEKDREASPVPFTVAPRLQSGDGIGSKRADQVVEGGTQVVGNLADDSRPSKKANLDVRHLGFDPQDTIAAITIELGWNDSIGWWRQDKVPNFEFDGLGLFFSPSNLFIAASKRMHSMSFP